MSNLPVKKQPDLFHTPAIHDLGSFREDSDIMSNPFFAIEKGRTQPIVLHEQSGKTRTHIKVTGADYGIANVWDNDILIYLRTQVAIAQQRGETVGRRMRFNVYDCLRATKRGTSARSYDAFRAALQRLKATTIITNITADGVQLDQGVNWINDYTIIAKTLKTGKVVMGACEVELSEWTWQMFQQARRMLAIDQAYFDLTGGLERKLYGIIRKHLGSNQPSWGIGLARLQELTGSTAPEAKFRYNIRQIVERQSLPGIILEITSDSRLPHIAAMGGEPVVKGKREYLNARPAPRALTAV